MKTRPNIVQLLREDIFFREAWTDFTTFHNGNPGDLLHRLGLLMVKPDGVASGKTRDILSFLEAQQFDIINVASVQLTRTMIRSLWRDDWRIYSADRLNFSDYLYGAADAVVFLVLDASGGGAEGANRLSDLKGPAEVSKRNPFHLRSVLGSPDRVINYVHSADNPESVFRELAILFNRTRRVRLFAQASQDEMLSEIERIEANNPAYHFDFDRALASMNLPDDLRAQVASGQKISFNTLLDAFKLGNGRDGYWDLVTVAKETIDLDLRLTLSGSGEDTGEDGLALPNTPDAWQDGVRSALLDARSIRDTLNDLPSPYTEPAGIFRVQGAVAHKD